AGVALEHGDHLRRGATLVAQAAEPEAGLQADGDLGLHVGELLLDQLVGGDGAAELLAVQRIVARRQPAELGGAQGTPGYAVARVVEAAERTLEPADIGQQVALRHEDVFHYDLAGHRRAQRELALDRGRGEAGHAALQDETADDPGVVLGPDDEDVGN